MKRALFTLTALLCGFALSAQTSSPVRISGREVLWDDFLTEECTAQKVMHSPWYKAPVVTLIREDGIKARSCEIFGDSTDRLVSFDRPLSEFAGRPVRMLLELSDADVYAFEFK